MNMKTRIGDIEVSTVSLPFNHGLFPGDPPMWFETMIFGCDDDELVYFQRRYATVEEALAGHEETVRMVRDKKEAAPSDS